MASHVIVVEVGPDGALSVELQKTTAGLGFSLEGGKASAQGDRPLYVKRIFRGTCFSPLEGDIVVVHSLYKQNRM